MKTLMLSLLLIVSTASHAAMSKVTAPDFTLKSNIGKNLRLSEYRGQVVLINFWASWCGPCRQEMPVLDELHQSYEALGFSVLGINVDKKSEAADKLLKDIPVSFPILYDNSNAASELFNVDAMPYTILVDRDGKMRYLHRGYKRGYEDKYREQIKALIRE